MRIIPICDIYEVAMLSATGFLIWMKKARARRRSTRASKVGVERGTIA
jgi:hypothetical protein